MMAGSCLCFVLVMHCHRLKGLVEEAEGVISNCSWSVSSTFPRIFPYLPTFSVILGVLGKAQTLPKCSVVLAACWKGWGSGIVYHAGTWLP